MHSTVQLIEKRLRAFGRGESGAVAIITASLLIFFLGLVALAVDIGHLTMVKSELQRTADAAALAGAMGLAPYTGSYTNPTPNWSQGQTKAQEVIGKTANEADNQVFSSGDGSVSCGYWLVNPPSGYEQSLPPARPVTPGYVPVPAVSVTLTRNVNLYFAPVMGQANPQSITATGIAILPEAYSVPNIPPIAVSLDTVYDNINGTLVMDISQQDIKIQSNKGVAAWFNLDGGNSVPSVLYSTPLTSVQDQVYLVPGTKATLTDLISVGQIIVLPVVDDVEQKVWKPILQFAGFKVDQLSANSMEGHFVNKFYDPFIKPTPYNESYSPVWGAPHLVK